MVVAILAGMMSPLFMKTVNQQREERSREATRLAFEALFGAKDRRSANLRADIGFNPTASLADLSVLLVKSGSGGIWAGVKDYGTDATYGLTWGYNGPYWNGSSGGNQPLDGWGRPLRLAVTGTAPNQTWQVISCGANGLYEAGAGDDVCYPAVPAKALAFTAVVNVTITYTGYQSGSIAAYSRNPTGTSLLAQNWFIPPNTSGASPWTWTNQLSPPTLSFNVPAGGLVVVITVAGATTTHLLDLMPGESRDFGVNL